MRVSSPRLGMGRRPGGVWARGLAVGVAAALLGGCSLVSKPVAPPCPPVYILSDAARVTKFRPGPGRDLTDVMIEAEIVAFSGGCTHEPKKNEVVVDLQVGFDVRRGPAANDRTAELTYFVAIPKFYPAAEAKGEFVVPVTFPEGVDQARVVDDQVVLRIPRAEKDTVDDYVIYLGFQTSPEELEMNRRMKR